MRRILRLCLLVAGAALLLAGLLAPTAAPTTLAQGVPPRPTLTPPPRPTTEAGPTATPRRSESPRATATPLGRITGTVIDLTTGAPVPGIVVQVGDAFVATDVNGNYDRGGLPAGNYDVQLRLEPGQGEPAQGLLTVALGPGETVVQHLALRTPPPAPPAAEEVAPTAAPAPVPAQLPQTAGRDDRPDLLLVLGVALIVAGLGLRRRPAAG